MSDEGKIKKVEKKPAYYVENTVRRVGTRLHRARSATRHRFKIFIGGQRVLRNKKLALTEEQFKLHEERIKELMLAGKVAVHTPDGVRMSYLPDGRMVHRKSNGAVKIVEGADVPPVKSAPKKEAAPEPKPAPAPEPEPEAPEESSEDILTNLPSIGASRANKLKAADLGTFAAIAAAKPARLMSVLGVTEEVANEVIEAAKKAD